MTKLFLPKHRGTPSIEEEIEKLLAAHPDEPRDALLQLLQRKIQSHYDGGMEPAAPSSPLGIGRYVYFFGGPTTEGRADLKNLLGGKGAHLAEMARLGCPVPPGFTISTEVCDMFNKRGGFPEEVRPQVIERLDKLQKMIGKQFGSTTDPLLLSVRSGAAVSMPGMMDTVLNLGLTDATLPGLISVTNNPRFAWDSYRRFIQMFGNVVKGIEGSKFEHNLEHVKAHKGVKLDTDLTTEDLQEIVALHKKTYESNVGSAFPQDPVQQLWESINAVFNSWNNPRAIKYRELNEIAGLLGTAVNVQSMVFGNMGTDSATGVCFSRNPSTGEAVFYGEYLTNAQGEDVVAGIRTPYQITKPASKQWAERQGISEEVRLRDFPSLEELMPGVFGELERIKDMLEQHYHDMQDMEFTIQQGTLYMLQTRTGKRTAHAAVRIAVEMVHEGLIDEKTAVMRVNPKQLDQLLHPTIDPSARGVSITRGLPASPGAGVGRIVFSAEDAEAWAKRGEQVVLVRLETSPEDIAGMSVAKGIFTARGGMTSHAAVVARGMGTPCVAGCGELVPNYADKTCTLAGRPYKEGDWITLNGNTGEVFDGKVPLVEPQLTGGFKSLMDWCARYRKLKVRTNADTPKDAQTAMKFGAEGVGLCRTEHMFFDHDRIDVVREMIIAEDTAGRVAALAKLKPMQKKDFIGIFEAMEGHPVTIRLLDPPLHEFLPQDDFTALAQKLNVPAATIARRVKQLHEANPMLGHRGCRLGITYPEIYEMQVQAIIEAAIEVKASGKPVAPPEIMIPLVGKLQEFTFTRKSAQKAIEEVFEKTGYHLKYSLGTMIEVPRAALTAGDIAKEAEFFSFGTNDLTQMACGFSRDDAASFLLEYIKLGIYEKDPFQVLDQEGVGRLIRLAVSEGRQSRPGLKCGICGEHGGDPTTINFCHRVGLNYVSCSPYRVPIAMLAAAQAALEYDH